jgi:D-lyxose ketol-isomerase
MLTARQHQEAVNRAVAMLNDAGIVITPEECEHLEVADFGLGEIEKTGLEIVVYVNTRRCCAKELVVFPEQTCPEHWHPTIGDQLGKEETFRCRWGVVYLNVPGERTAEPMSQPPHGSERYYSVFHEVSLGPGDQYTLPPDTPHWFQAGPQGCIVSEFSTQSTDDADTFRDPRIVRRPRTA